MYKTKQKKGQRTYQAYLGKSVLISVDLWAGHAWLFIYTHEIDTLQFIRNELKECGQQVYLSKEKLLLFFSDMNNQSEYVVLVVYDELLL